MIALWIAVIGCSTQGPQVTEPRTEGELVFRDPETCRECHPGAVDYEGVRDIRMQAVGSAGKASSRSEATRIAELDDPGKDREREKKPGVEDRGYLWRLNSYWRFKQVPEGVVVECESISLSRTIPIAFRWVVKPFINSVPRESLEAALRPMREAFAATPN